MSRGVNRNPSATVDAVAHTGSNRNMEHVATYFTALQSCNRAEITEHSLRPELTALLTSIARQVDGQITILHEGKREGQFGAPDFKISRVENIIGYVENKQIGADLEKILKSPQIKKYQQLSENILLTNYLDWIWLRQGKPQRATLCTLAEIDDRRASLDPERAAAVDRLIRSFLSFAPQGIGTPQALARAFALRGKILQEFLAVELQRQQQQDVRGKLFGLYETFQKYVFQALTLEAFADAFAQNLIYGLFLAKLNAATTPITLYNAETFIPTNFELIRELVEFLKVLHRKEYTDIRWVVEEVLTILNTLNLREINAALSFTKPTEGEQADPYAARDPYVYFYEDFLAAYDKRLRKAKGVYYTPPPVVNFIVRAVDDLLRETFGLSQGLADHQRVTVLDFATGTGTFLLEVIRQILGRYPGPQQQEMRRLMIHDHLLHNLYGFEYLLAPYTIAHLKLSQFLHDQGYTLGDEERFQIFLTNTLEPVDPQINIPMLPALTQEARQAQEVKDHPILVIMGNPPYSGHSQNTGDWITGKIKSYYYVDGKKLNEKNPKWLQDDYVKFIRFAQWKMEQVEEGIVAIITNHSFLDNPTFRGMRQSLMQTFDQMYFVDLHGNAKKKEQTPEGGKDENVFDIEQGVASSLLVKKKGLERKIYRADFWGTRENKYTLCLESQLSS
ncbi:N-6 DNA methylase, partial [candidate division KSB3 bacterium]|nr:N-6 DNA methylase [candidate division KSB3 bacterium]MBD3326830.1 N-6 DNA methylase [candidate division KSB3 bacterium]